MLSLPIFPLSRALLAVVFLAVGSHATASITTQPPGLNPGDPYRLVFVTSTSTNALPDGVGYYNDFVNNAANSVDELADLNTDWRAIVSSTTFGANENTGTHFGVGVPIYGLDGVRIADDYIDLWDGTIDSPINRTELGTIRSFQVWTGSLPDGTPFVTYAAGGGILIDLSINSTTPFVGDSSFISDRWIHRSNLFSQSSGAVLYGMSGVLTAQAVVPPVPEPSSLVCFGGLLMLAGWQRSGRRAARGTGCRTAAPQ